MPTYYVKGADGHTYGIEAPEGTKDAVIQAAILREFPEAGKPKAAPGSSPEEMAKTGLAGTDLLDRILINYGAGTDAVIKGVQGLLGMGPSDQEIEQKRAIDRATAEQTTISDKLPDWLPTAGQVAQFLGEAAPTLAVPGSGFVRGGKALLTLGKGLPAASRLGTVAAATDAAIGGGLMGAAQMATEDESRLLNTVLGAVGGAGISALIAGGASVRRMLTSGGAASKAAAKLVQMAGGEKEADAVLAKLRSYNPQGVTKDIPMSVAEISQNPGLAVGERAAAASDTANWVPFRQAQNQARRDALEAATQADLSGARAARSEASRPLREGAMTTAETSGADFVTPVEARITWMMEGEAGADPATRTIAGYVKSNMGDAATPERMYRMRKVLLDKLNGRPQLGDDLSAAVKARRQETMSVVKAIDEALDGASGGQWTDYLKAYASKSGEVDDATALKLIRKSFTKGGMEVPLTGNRLATSIERYGKNDYGDKLLPQSRANLGDLQDNIAMSEGLQRNVKNTGTSGGGSNTAMDLAGMAVTALDHKTGGAINLLRKLMGNDETTRAMVSAALRDPQSFTAAVSRKLAQRLPLTRAEESVLLLLRSTGSLGTLGLVAPQ